MTTLQHTAPFRPRTIDFWRAYGVHMRPYLLFVSGITGIAGLSYGAEIGTLSAAVLGLAFFLSYGFGQALTDCSQTDTDSISSPYRPLVQGILTREDVRYVSLAGLTLCGAVMVLGNVLAAPLALLGIVGLLTYTYFKRRWWAGPFYNAWIVAVVYLLGVLDGAPSAGFSLLGQPAVLATASAVFFGYANFVLSGYFKDVPADRATGYNTLPVRYGLKVATLVSDGFALITLASFGVALNLLAVETYSSAQLATIVLFAGAGIFSTVLAQARLHNVADDKDAHRAINPVVHAYVLLLSAITATQQPSWALFLAAFYAAFVVTMRRRPEAQQI